MEFTVADFGGPLHADSIELRRRVLRIPLGLDFSEFELEAEEDQLHIVGTMDGRVLAVALLVRTESGLAQMRQVAVDPDLQGQGVGRQLVDTFERVARERGYPGIMMHARETAIPFYLRLGYEITSEPFEEVGIPHRKMHKSLTSTED